MEKEKALFVRFAGIYWSGLFLFSAYAFIMQPDQLQFLGTALSGLAPLLFFLILRWRPTTHADIEITFAGAFCFAMNLIVIGQIALNGRPQVYLPYLSAGALVLWLFYSYFICKVPKNSGFRLSDNLKRQIDKSNAKTAFVFVTGADDFTCAAMIKDLSSERMSEISDRVIVVSKNPITVNESGLRFVTEKDLKIPLRYSGKFALSGIGEPGYIPGLIIADNEGKVVFEKWWSDARKRQDASFVARLLF